ncbi:MAG: hypothetical protein M1434_05415 [Chloroflexi bacterium]|nr:hypothetical protein [Chloroflexota bacterium]MCL5274173.1 hypothetical protein [Chloroflexota bacterium]
MKANSKPASSSAHPALYAILILFIVSGLIYSVSTPFLNVSDEVRHYAMVEQLAQGKGLPVQNPAQHGFYEQEGSQPPLYYAMMALVALPFDRSDFMQLAQFNPHARLGRADATNNFNQLIHTDAEKFPWHGTALVVQLIRFIGIAMGALTVWCTYLLARTLLPVADDQAAQRVITLAPLAAAALTAFNPMFVFISASVNNDTLAALLSSLGLLLGARIVRTGLTWRRAAVLGIVLGCAAITKSSALALVVIVPVAILAAEWVRRRGESARAIVRDSILRILPALALIAIIAGWWYVRNASLYNGDFTGTTMMATIAGPRDSLPTPLELLGEWDGFRKAYLGLFGAVNIPMADWIYSLFDGLLILAGIGLLLVARDWLIGKRDKVQAIAVLMCFGTFVVEFAALIRWTSITLASQGRLLFPVIAVISTFVAWGLCRLAGITIARGANARLRQIATSATHAAVALVCAGFGALTLASPFLYIRPAYALPPVLHSEALVPADITRTELRFADSIRWIGYRVETPRIQPGGEFDVTLYWQGLKPMNTNYSAFIRLYGRSDAQVFLLDTYPGGGMWQTTRWQPGDIVVDRYRLRVPATLTNTSLMPTALWLDAGYWNLDTKQFLPTYDGAGNPSGRQRYEAGAMAQRPGGAAPTEPPGPHLSNAIPAVTDMAQQDGKLMVTLTWRVTAGFNEDYTVFMHLFDARGVKVAQADGRAKNGNFSTRWWLAGDVVTDTHTFELPKGLPAGAYTIKFGLYRPGDGARMPAFDAQRQPINDAAITQPVTIK